MTVVPLNRLAEPRWRIIPCYEYGRIEVGPEDVLGPDGRLNLAPAVLNRYVKADFVDDTFRLSALGVSGLIPLTDRIAIQVRPRFPIRNLTHMVAVCGYAPTTIAALRDYQATDEEQEWLLDVMTEGLLAGIDTICLNGLLRTYVRRTEAGSYPHGRVNTTASMLRFNARGVNHKAEYSWFERTADNPPNRCLKTAVASLHSRYVNAPQRKGTRERIGRLAEAMRVLHDVTLEPRPFSLKDPVVRGATPLPETRAYYRPALELAVAIMTGRGVDLDAGEGGEVHIPSLLVKTEDLFEEFIRASLRESLSDHPGLSVLDGNMGPGQVRLYETLAPHEKTSLPEHHEPVAVREPGANPDVVFRLTDGSHPLIADVKYSNVKGYADRSEVEQVVLYGHRYRSPVSMTIHPRRASSKKGLFISGRIGSTIVAQYRVDLGAEDLEAEMEEMAERISELIASQTPSPSSASPGSLPSA